jgi:ribosomal-protein-alanine N-acetyltransferase
MQRTERREISVEKQKDGGVAMAKRLRIREATPSDARELVEVEERSFGGWATWDMQGILRRVRNPSAIFLKAEMGGQIVGKSVGIIYKGKKKKSLQVHDVSVLPSCRRNGVASKLLAYLEFKAQERGCEYSALFVRENNWTARRLYGKLGYYDIYGRGEKGMQRMRKDLNGA